MKENHHEHYRKEYQLKVLQEHGLPDNPYNLFHTWLQEAIDSQITEPLAMNLATVSKYNRPSSRIVLLRNWSEDGFVFFTHYRSRKGLDLEANTMAALTFFWPPLERQIRIEGRTEKIASEDSDTYFSNRPLGSQISASISDQSQPIPDRQYLEDLYEKKKSELGPNMPSRPPWWGGYIVYPDSIEFWQGRLFRLHDRIQYLRSNKKWTRKRLAP